MPIYEYQCGKCEHEFEREQRITDSPVKTCPKCRSRRVKKLISQTSFVLKGSGWYSDLYSSPGEKKSADSESTKTAETKKNDGADDKKKKKKDSKSEAKPKSDKAKSAA